MGEKAGHPFRGNQFGSGKGGGKGGGAGAGLSTGHKPGGPMDKLSRELLANPETRAAELKDIAANRVKSGSYGSAKERGAKISQANADVKAAFKGRSPAERFSQKQSDAASELRRIEATYGPNHPAVRQAQRGKESARAAAAIRLSKNQEFVNSSSHDISSTVAKAQAEIDARKAKPVASTYKREWLGANPATVKAERKARADSLRADRRNEKMRAKLLSQEDVTAAVFKKETAGMKPWNVRRAKFRG